MAEELSKNVLIGFIILCLIAVIMIVWITKAKQEYWTITGKELCKKSVELIAEQKSLKIKGTALIDKYGNPAELKCYTNYQTISESDDNVVKRDIANAMYDCWDQYGQGKVEIFDTTDNNYCVVCSSLEFTSKKEITGLTDFLIKEKPMPTSTETYFKFLFGTKAKDNEILAKYETELKNKDKLELDGPLAVMFIMDKNAFPEAKLGTNQGKVVTAAAGNVAGAAVGLFTGLALCGTGFGCIAGVGIIVTAAGTMIGYTIGSDSAAEWDARVLLTNYNNIGKLECTRLEGRSTPIRPVEMNKYK